MSNNRAEVIEGLVIEAYPDLRRMARRLAEGTQAQDLTQAGAEAALRIWRANPETSKAYVMTAARRAMIEYRAEDLVVKVPRSTRRLVHAARRLMTQDGLPIDAAAREVGITVLTMLDVERAEALARNDATDSADGGDPHIPADATVLLDRPAAAEWADEVDEAAEVGRVRLALRQLPTALRQVLEWKHLGAPLPDGMSRATAYRRLPDAESAFAAVWGSVDIIAADEAAREERRWDEFWRSAGASGHGRGTTSQR